MIPKIFITPSLETRIGEIEKVLSQFKFSKNHPDLLYFEAESKLGIEQARAVKDHFSTKPYQAEGRVVVIEDASNLTIEAQNALLKTLEEAPEKALIILGINKEPDLLPTVLSRCEIINMPETDTPIYGYTDIPELLNSTIEERFEYIEKLKERTEFLEALTVFWRNKLLNNPNSQTRKFLEELMTAKKWQAQNVNIRAILEYLMLVMPGV